MMHMHIVLHLLPRQVWKASTIKRTHGINAAHIGLQVQELTRLFHIHPVADLIKIEIFFLEFIHRHIQMSRDPDQIFLSESGAHCFAAVGAGQAVHFLPNFLIDLFGHHVQLAGWVFTELGEEDPEAAFIQFHRFAKGTKVDGLHSSE